MRKIFYVLLMATVLLVNTMGVSGKELNVLKDGIEEVRAKLPEVEKSEEVVVEGQTELDVNKIVPLENGNYYIDTFEVEAENVPYFPMIPSNNTVNPFATTTTSSAVTRTITKTRTLYGANNNKLWDVAVTGTFSYVWGVSSTCTNSVVNATSYVTNVWKISDKKASKKGNTATASAKGTAYSTIIPFIVMETITETVTLTMNVHGIYK